MILLTILASITLLVIGFVSAIFVCSWFLDEESKRLGGMLERIEVKLANLEQRVNASPSGDEWHLETRQVIGALYKALGYAIERKEVPDPRYLPGPQRMTRVIVAKKIDRSKKA